MQGVPIVKLSVTVLILCLAFIVAGTVLAVTGHSDLANGAFGNVTGLVIGAGTGVGVVVQSQRSNGKNDPTGGITQ